MDEQFSKWWEDGNNRWADGKETAREAFTAAYSLGLAKGHKEGMGDKPSGWLITGSSIYADAAVTSEGMADKRIAERNDGASYKVPLYAIRQAAQEKPDAAP